MRTTKVSLLASVVMTAMATTASAQVSTFGDMADTVGSQAGQVADLIGVGVFILGIILAAAGLMKFKKNSDNPQDPSNKISTAFVLVFVGAAMVAMPTLLGVGVTSFFGQGAGTVDADQGGGDMRSIQNGGTIGGG